MEVEVFNEYKLALLEALDKKSASVDNIKFVEKYVDDTDKLEDLVVSELEPELINTMSALEQYTGLKSSSVDSLSRDPASFDELFEREIVRLSELSADVDLRRRFLRQHFAAYLKKSKLVLLELVPRIRLQKLFIDFQRMRIAQLERSLRDERERGDVARQRLRQLRHSQQASR